ncbi:MAG: hypothetical protein HY811_00970 [Planctomycetes bacterium]|nr:hypothetical protein [Planctomycetota bacterium]
MVKETTDKGRLCEVCFKPFPFQAIRMAGARDLCPECLWRTKKQEENARVEKSPKPERKEISVEHDKFLSSRTLFRILFNLLRLAILISTMLFMDAMGDFRGYFEGLLISDFVCLLVYRLKTHDNFPVIETIISAVTIVSTIATITDGESFFLVFGFVFTLLFKVAYYRMLYLMKKQRASKTHETLYP